MISVEDIRSSIRRVVSHRLSDDRSFSSGAPRRVSQAKYFFAAALTKGKLSTFPFPFPPTFVVRIYVEISDDLYFYSKGRSKARILSSYLMNKCTMFSVIFGLLDVFSDSNAAKSISKYPKSGR